MKHLLITIAAVVLVGYGESQQSATTPQEIPIHEAAKLGNIEDVKRLLADGANVNAKNDNGSTPLHNAVWIGRKEVAELLIANGADVNAKEDENGISPLHWAVKEGHKEIIELLIDKGADVNAKSVLGRTPLDWCELNRGSNDSTQVKATIKEIADLCRKHGAKTGEELKAEGR